MADSFVHLHVHTEYSMLDGAAKVAPLFEEAERLGMTAVGMSDHGNMYGSDEFYQTASKTGIKPMMSGISRSPLSSKVNLTLRSPVFSTLATFL